MDTSTQAAEPILDATEPAPSSDETESVYAWSHADDDDTLVFHRRSWKLPIAVAALAVAAVATVGGVKVWPHHSTPGSPAAPAASPAVMPAPAPIAQSADPDTRFFSLLANGNYRLNKPGDRQEAIVSGHEVCRARHDGHDADWIMRYWTDTNPQNTPDTTRLFVYSAFDAYCPNG